MEFTKRTLLKQIGVTTALTTGFSGATVAFSGENFIHDIRIETASNDSQSLFAYTTLKGTTFVLYLASGTTDPETSPTNVTQLTSADNGSVQNIRWEKSSKLRFWQDGKLKQISIKENGSPTEPQPVKNAEAPQDQTLISTTPSLSPDAVTKPPGGGSPDWVDDDVYYHEGTKECQSITGLGVEWFEVCMQISSISPKVYTTCTGTEKTLVGGSINGISVSTPVGSGSIGIDLWVAHDPVEQCLYYGSETLNWCSKTCQIDLDATEAEIRSAIEDDLLDMFNDLADYFPDMPEVEYDPNSGEITNLVIGVFLFIIALLLSWTGTTA